MSTYSANPPTANGTTSAPSTHKGVQKVVVVNSSSEILALAERALAAGNYDVVFVEAIAHAYSQVRRIQPNLVILCLRIGDMGAFQLLSMLKLDPETRGIPVLTYTANEAEPSPSSDVEAETSEFFARRAVALMN
jgi:CheY-like chemotaxis protein